jgi:uncharacterized protein YdiU (UPF0061 family)
MTTLARLRFDNHYARLGPDFSSALAPTPLPAPYRVSVNPDVAALLGIDPADLDTPDFTAIAAGNALPPGAEPVSMLYSGHQFGHYVPQLGDGRAILLGQVQGADGASWDLQLKGAGLTPYSRTADGRAVLRSTIREYLCSEAMHHLGIPSTRALAVVGSDHPVLRESVETAAVLTRVAPSHVRFGSFEVFHYRGQPELSRRLAEYVIERHFPDLAASHPAAARPRELLREVCLRTARLVAQWQAVGFAHGVMNTDNMSILGLTFDYGPFGFVERYDPDFISNHSDDTGRYALSNQPDIAFWNVCCLAEALTALVPVEECRDALGAFEPAFRRAQLQAWRAKLGLAEPRESDPALVTRLLGLLQAAGADYTRFLRALADLDPTAPSTVAALRDEGRHAEAFEPWLADYRARLAAESVPAAERRARMRRANPRYVLRNWLAQRAIERAQRGDFSEVDRLLALLRHPCDEQPGWDEYARPAPEHILAPEVSCSS